jgi:hypothetical protein
MHVGFWGWVRRALGLPFCGMGFARRFSG